MNIYLTGTEYTGKTTLAGEIMKWAERTMDGTTHFHDHFTMPSSELSPEAAESLVHSEDDNAVMSSVGGRTPLPVVRHHQLEAGPHSRR
jgi:hypothetical protein